MEFLEMDAGQIQSFFPKRDPYAHKGHFGRDLLLCGSRGFTGAAALAARGALRVGAGLVFLGVPNSIYAIEAVKLDEPVVFPLADSNGMYAGEAVKEIRERMRNMDTVLIGPGMGQSPGTLEVLSCVLKEFPGPVVVDADGINLLSAHMDLLRDRTAPTILTPHEGEFARLFGPITDRQENAVRFSQEFGAILVLKGHETLITDGKTLFRNPTGNPGMAVGGSGDVLAGMIAGLLGQGFSPVRAAAVGAWLHGKAGDLCAERLGEYGMLPTDMLEVLPQLIR